jgi:hypothetical protein
VLRTLFNLTLRNFRQIQLDETKKSDPDFSGFAVYRKASGTDERLKRISNQAIVSSFTDTGLENGISYDYSITKTYRNSFESGFVENFSVAPSAFTSQQQLVIGQEVVVQPGDGTITFYVDYNRKFKASELLDKVLTINTQQSSEEPRKFIVEVRVQDLLGNPVSLSTFSISATGRKD